MTRFAATSRLETKPNVARRAPVRSPPKAPPQRSATVQPKLRIGAVDDPLEREADRMAARVVRPSASSAGGAPRGERLQRKAVATPAPGRRAAVSPSRHFAGELAAARATGGSALPSSARAELEPRFGLDFGGVRVHANTRAERLSRQIGARAFTIGGDIFFQRREYSPDSGEGQRLLAHELTHVAQQGAAGPGVQPGLIQRQPDPRARPSARGAPAGHRLLIWLGSNVVDFQTQRGVERYTLTQREGLQPGHFSAHVTIIGNSIRFDFG